MSGQEQRDEQSQQPELGGASEATLTPGAVTRTIAEETRTDDALPIPGLRVREIYANDTEPDDQPS